MTNKIFPKPARFRNPCSAPMFPPKRRY